MKLTSLQNLPHYFNSNSSARYVLFGQVWITTRIEKLECFCVFQCYFLGGTADAATGILGEMSKPMSWGMPALKVCEKLKKKDRQVCELAYGKPTTRNHTKVLLSSVYPGLFLAIFQKNSRIKNSSKKGRKPPNPPILT